MRIRRQAQQGVSSTWQLHLEGVRKSMMLRGGFQSLVRSSNLTALLVSFLRYI